jgi:NAD-dependent dihydropyrimidine dehydrogenase PreA subunit
MQVSIDQEICAGCGACTDICPEQAIQLIAARAIVDQEKCTGCGQCVDECPSGAISLVPQALVPGPQMYPTIREEPVQGEIIVPTTQPVSLKKTALSILFDRLLPGIADILISTLKQRMLTPADMPTSMQAGMDAPTRARMETRPRQRRRRAGRKWSNKR